MESNVLKAKLEVTLAAEQMITQICALEPEVITSIETTRAKRLQQISVAKQNIFSLLKQLNQAVDFADNIVKRSSSTDIMQNKGTLTQRFEELRAIYHEVPKYRDIVHVKFTAASMAGLKLGSVQMTEKTDVKKSTLQGIHQTLRAGVEVDYLLCPKTTSGEMCDLELKFTPILPGDYSLEVKINGEKLSVCPVTVQVKECELVVDGELDLKNFSDAELKGPFGIALNAEGTMAVSDLHGQSVYVFDSEGTFLQKIGQFKQPVDAVFVNDEEILVSDHGDHRIYQYNTRSGLFIKKFGKPGTGKGKVRKST